MMNKLFRALLVLTHVVVFTYAVASASFESDIIIPETDDPQLRVISSSSSPRPEKALPSQACLQGQDSVLTGLPTGRGRLGGAAVADRGSM